jgi:cell division protein FtsN
MIAKKICIGLSFLLLLSSCQSKPKQAKRKSFQVVNKEGDVVSLNRQVPKYNQEQIAKQKMSNPNIMIMNGNIDYNQSMQKDIFADKAPTKTFVDIKPDNEVKNDKEIFKVTDQEKKLKKEIIQKKENGQISNRATQINKKEKTPIKEVNINNEKSLRNSNGATNNKIKKTVIATTPKKQTAKKKTKKTSKNGKFYIQIGAYSLKSNAEKSLNKYSNINKGMVKNYTNSKGVVIYRTVLGPYNSRAQAENDLEKVIQRGHYDVYITRK